MRASPRVKVLHALDGETHRLSPALSSAGSGGEGARRAGEEAARGSKTRNPVWRNFLLGVLVLGGLLSAHAQSSSLDWSTAAGGGGASSGGNYTLSGTSGQPDAGTLSGGSYTLEGGFWPGIVVPSTTGAPILFVRVSGGTATISWSSTATGFVLEETGNLSTPSWSAAPQGNPVTIPLGGASTFFRLRGP